MKTFAKIGRVQLIGEWKPQNGVVALWPLLIYFSPKVESNAGCHDLTLGWICGGLTLRVVAK